MALGAAQRPPHAQGNVRHVAERDTSRERGGYEGAAVSVRVAPLSVGRLRVGWALCGGADCRYRTGNPCEEGIGRHRHIHIQHLLDSVGLLKLSDDLRNTSVVLFTQFTEMYLSDDLGSLVKYLVPS